MTMIKRETLVHADWQREEVEVEALGGSVAVVQMALATRLAAEKLASELDREDPASVYKTIPHVLAGCILDADGAPLMTPSQWAVFGANHRGESVMLFNKAMELSGFNGTGQPPAETIEKN
jgi:hypothetical protein